MLQGAWASSLLFVEYSGNMSMFWGWGLRGVSCPLDPNQLNVGLGKNCKLSEVVARNDNRTTLWSYLMRFYDCCICILMWCLPSASDSLHSHGLYSPWNSPGQNTGLGSLSLLQGILPSQEANQGLCLAGGFFTSWATRKAPETGGTAILCAIS